MPDNAKKSTSAGPITGNSKPILPVSSGARGNNVNASKPPRIAQSQPRTSTGAAPPQHAMVPPVPVAPVAPSHPAVMGFISPAALQTSMPPPLIHPFAPVLHRAPKPHLTPTVFFNKKLRSGKWIQEEEKYAELLIGLFENGQIEDCENGCTLRSFLSRRLHCAPMRISKKYAGKGIGKMVFLSKLNVGISIPLDNNAPKTRDSRIKHMEDAFYKAVFPGGDFHNTFNAHTRIEAPKAPPVPIIPGMISIVAPPPFPFPMPAFAPNGFPKPTLPGARVPNMPAHAVLAPVGVAAQTKQLHDSYMKALKQAPIFAASIAQGVPTAMPIAPAAVAVMAPQWGTQVNATGQVQYVPTTGGVIPSAVAEVPDFLTGFDSVASAAGGDRKVAAAAPVVADGALQYSPPFTSRSFDDFHRFLGKDLSLLDDDVTCTKTTSVSAQGYQSETATSSDFPEIDTMALFSADSYAMFAQESAIAASQHAAYLSHEPLASSVPGYFDVEGLMKLVSGQPEEIEEQSLPILPGSLVPLAAPQVVVHRQPVPLEMNEPVPSDLENLMTLVAGGMEQTLDHPVPVAPSAMPRKLAPVTASHGPKRKLIESPMSKGMTPVERLYGSRRDVAEVSGSEPSNSATETESNSWSGRGSSSDRDGSDNTSNDCTTDMGSNDSESNSSDSQSDEGPERKKHKSVIATHRIHHATELENIQIKR